MKAMVLAAGKGKRMRPLSDRIPKPLLPIGGKPLLQYHIEALAEAGIKDLVINHALMGEMIEDYFGDGRSFNVNIEYSAEGSEPLETGGGILHALPALGEKPFIVVNSDVWTDYDFSRLPEEPKGLAHLVLVGNPEHNPNGDFWLQKGKLELKGPELFTYSGIGVYRPSLFKDTKERAFPLAPLLRTAIQRTQIYGEFYSGEWLDVGTPERLEAANTSLNSRK